MNRITIDQYFMEIATVVAKRGTCPKAQVGAVLVKNKSIISTGYNGSPRGVAHCYQEGCNEVAGHCQRAVHAEMNAMLQAAMHGNSTIDATLYCTHFPCNHCLKGIINAGISKIVYEKPYKNGENFITHNLELVQVEVSKPETIVEIKDIQTKV
ncbi:dCMP deaminase family protein [Candidatus Peregrinibacteria bacterium]|nr:MAG: dCMP deaminase family protein [Candidatus Peregrinibacteria bacterium]